MIWTKLWISSAEKVSSTDRGAGDWVRGCSEAAGARARQTMLAALRTSAFTITSSPSKLISTTLWGVAGSHHDS
eukprot:1883365-Prymnesium_polylepis.1